MRDIDSHNTYSEICSVDDRSNLLKHLETHHSANSYY